jgi:hypothetical protein
LSEENLFFVQFEVVDFQNTFTWNTHNHTFFVFISFPTKESGNLAFITTMAKPPIWDNAQHTQLNHDLVPHPCDFAMLHHGSIMLFHRGFEGIKEI